MRGTGRSGNHVSRPRDRASLPRVRPRDDSSHQLCSAAGTCRVSLSFMDREVNGAMITRPNESAWPRPSNDSWRSGLIAVLNVAAFVLILSHYFSSGLADAPLSFRYYLSTLPT